jgi:CheY-like chemotaxis protein
MKNESTRILMVEDSPTQALMLENTLQQQGFVTRIARNGEEALALLDDFKPTVIISDIVMPGIDGYELCRQIKANPDTKDIPVILLTSLSDPYDVILGLQCGADNFITKPYKEEFLLSRISYILINQELRKTLPDEGGVQIYFGGQKISVTSSRIQIVDLLFSSFENAVQKNQELKNVNRELERTQERLKEAIKSAEAANAAKSNFLANMSHDIRTPMNGIVGMTDLLNDTNLTSTQHEFLDIIQQSSGSLLNLINDILDFSKIEAGKLDISETPFNLREYIGTVLKTLAVRADQKDIELACRVDPNTPEMIVSDPHRLGQILINVIGNAIKFTDEGEIVVQVHQHQTGDKKNELHFTIQDTGCGIPPEKCTSVFDAFSQIKGNDAHVLQGTGLGLAICSKLTELMGGKIWVESVLGQGSTFHFIIRTSTVETKTSPVRFDDLRVLVLDDNATVLGFAQQTLKEAGASVTALQNPADLIGQLSKAQKDGQPFDILIIDTRIPGADAFALIREVIKQKFSCVILPALAASTLREDSAQCTELDLTHRLTKPLSDTSLLAKLQAVVSPSDKKEISIDNARSVDSEQIRPLKILVAEDNRVNQMVATRMLTAMGHTLIIVNNGQEAVLALEKEDFDLVLMDMKMPIMDGYTATQTIRNSSSVKNPKIPIIALTANAMKGDKELCLEKGMNGYAAKPLQSKELAKAITETLFA